MRSIIDVLNELKIEWKEGGTHRHIRAGWIGITPCPYCGSTEFHLGYNLTGGFTTCWRCGPQKTTDTLAAISGVSTQTIWGMLKELPRKLGSYEPSFKRTGKYKEPANVGPLQESHKRYLKSRRLDVDQCEKLWRLGGIGIAANLAWRIFMPIYYRSRTVSWTTRSIAEDSPRRYVSAHPHDEETPHKKILYGQDFVTNTVLVVEGPMDAIAIGPGAVSTFGLGATTSQMAYLSKIPTRYICLDNEPIARMKARKLAEMLKVMPGMTHIVELQDGKDPCDTTEKERAQLRKLLD